jgi:phosphoglycerate dehydrogenase-like enzyme
MNIVFTPILAPAVAAIGESLLPKGMSLEHLAPPSEQERRVEQLEGADFLMGFFSGSRLPASDYRHLQRVRLLQLLSAGYDGIDLEELRRLGLPLADNGGANAVAVAEHAILLMLALYRQLLDLDRLVRAGGWKDSQLGQEEAHEIEGKTIGIIGAGRIGRTLARRLGGWDVRLLYYDPVRVPADLEKSLQLNYCELDDLLRQSDIISLHAPGNASTHHLIGERTLALMKPTAVLVNCARGDLVDEAALDRALRARQIAGAGLDTFAQEPTAPQNPLFTLPNVVLTPHAAGPSWESWPKRFRNGYANIERVARGEPPLWVVPELRDMLAAASARS